MFIYKMKKKKKKKKKKKACGSTKSYPHFNIKTTITTITMINLNYYHCSYIIIITMIFII